MGETTTVMISQEVADGKSVIGKDTSMIKELETTLGGILLIQDVQEEAQSHIQTSDSDDKIYAVLNIHQKSDCSTKIHGSLSKCATFPSSGKTLPSALNGEDEVPGGALFGQSSMKYENTSCTRSRSMPTPRKLVSAMKGGREQQQGTPRLVKLNVTWAPDVYDPPATSLSHTVRSRHQRPKTTKRKDQKHKHKGKYVRGSSSEKKYHVNKRSISSSADHMQLRSQAPGSRSPPLDGFDQLTAEVIASFASRDTDGFDPQSEAVASINVAEFSVGGQDSKCGSSFMASLAKVHVSIAEATS